MLVAWRAVCVVSDATDVTYPSEACIVGPQLLLRKMLYTP
jgi:hypothetical protein